MAQALALTLVAPKPDDTPQQRLERLYKANRDDVYAYVATLLRDRSLAEDVTALAFERAFRRRRLFDPRRGSERAWLFGIARNAALDELRRRKRFVASDAEHAQHVHHASRERAGDEQLDAVLTRTAVRDAVAELPPRERELIALKFHAGLSNAELARVLGISQSNAATMLHRTITKLRKACHEQQ
jgi:RNA polymerase sigma-70 factor, ECF subfamily